MRNNQNIYVIINNLTLFLTLYLLTYAISRVHNVTKRGILFQLADITQHSTVLYYRTKLIFRLPAIKSEF